MNIRISRLLLLMALIGLTVQQCTEAGKYDDPANPGTCLDCVLPCENCTGAAVCTSCASPDMIFAAPSKLDSKN